MDETPDAGQQQPVLREGVALSANLRYVLTLHHPVTHRELQLFSRLELRRLCGIGPALFGELLRYYTESSIEPRSDNKPFIARATQLYGSVQAVPVSAVLSLALRGPNLKKASFVAIRHAVFGTGAKTLGELCGVLARTPQIPGLPDKQCLRISNWLSDNDLSWW